MCVSVVTRRCTDVATHSVAAGGASVATNASRAIGTTRVASCAVCRDRSAGPAGRAAWGGRAPARKPVRRWAGRTGTRTNLRGWPATAAEASLRAARASSVLDGGALQPCRCGEAAIPCWRARCGCPRRLEGGAHGAGRVCGSGPRCRRIARLHALAAADLADDDRLGRPRADGRRGAAAGTARRPRSPAARRCRRRCWRRSPTVSC